MAPFGTKGLAFVNPDGRTTFGPHALYVFVVGRSPSHYRLLEFFCPETRVYMMTGTYRLYPMNCSMSAIYKGDRMIITATDLLDACEVTVMATGATRREHARVLEK